MLPHRPAAHPPPPRAHPLRRAPPVLLVRQPLGLHHRRGRHVGRLERHVRASGDAAEAELEGEVLDEGRGQGRRRRTGAGEFGERGVGLGQGG